MIVSWFVLRVPTSRSTCDDAWVLRTARKHRSEKPAKQSTSFASVKHCFEPHGEAPPCSLKRRATQSHVCADVRDICERTRGGAHKKTMFTVPSRAV